MKDEVGFYDHYVHYTKYTFLFLKIFLKKKQRYVISVFEEEFLNLAQC